VWAEADVSGASADDVHEVAAEFGLDPLALEDALNARQRPKLEHYQRHAFLVLFQLDEVDAQLEPRQLGCFLSDRFVLVLHHGATRLIEEFDRRLDKEKSATDGTDRLVHLLVDTAVDDYEAIATGLGEEVEDLEGEALAVARLHEQDDDDDPRHNMPSQYRLYTLKQSVSMLRRYALPAGGALDQLVSSDEEWMVGPETQTLFRDVHDHTVRIEAQVRSVEELASGVLDLTRSLQADMLNEINKKLTGWAAIVAAPALLAGLYGINYTLLPKPSIGAWGFVFVIGTMVAASLSLYLLFRRKGWI
jgi:magnesium transporter